MPDDLDAFVSAVLAKDVERVRAVLSSSEQVRAQVNDPLFDFGQRAAHMVADHVALLDVLITSGADVNLRSDWKNGPFTVLDNADEESARFLMARGAALTAHAASRLGWLEELRTIIEGDPSAVHERGGDGQQPLHVAKTIEIADYLLARGAAIDARCIDHMSTPAQYALVERPEVCGRLLERGATPDIFMAAWRGDLALAERLLDADPSCVAACVDQPGYAPVPPFSIYCWSLGFMVSPHEIARKRGHVAVYGALMRRSPPRVQLLAAAAMADEALARDAISLDRSLPESLARSEHALLAHAIFHGRFESADLMLRLGFDPAAPGQDGGTALHMACWMGHAQLVERIVQQGAAPVNLKDPTHGSPPLGWAAFGSVCRRAEGGDYIGVIDNLVASGADVAAPGNMHGVPMVRMADGNPAVQEALRRHGARDIL